MTSYLTISEREDFYQLKLARKDFKDRIKELEEGRCALEAEVEALKQPNGGISKETVEQVLGGSIPAGETEATTFHELEKALRGHNGIQANLIEALEDKLARVTAERDELTRGQTLLEMTRSDLIKRNGTLLAKLESERKARQAWDAANPPKHSMDTLGYVTGSPSPLTPEGEEYVRKLGGKVPEDPRSALYREMLHILRQSQKFQNLTVNYHADIADLIQRAEQAMEGDA